MPIRGKEILKKQYPLAYDLVILKKKKKKKKEGSRTKSGDTSLPLVMHP